MPESTSNFTSTWKPSSPRLVCLSFCDQQCLQTAKGSRKQEKEQEERRGTGGEAA